MSDDFVTTKDCENRQKATMDLLKEINNRLFRDNGKKSFQTRLNAHENFIKIQIWVLSIIGASMILALVSLSFGIFKFVYMGGQ